ncbi:protein indeterminate-domain 2-like [Cynara cardunculus var. scolymus]|uniref:protein indeterminate-domain 2-like n=1 Tax=Cynara cardunculus var. scolymus TaxID=59895 RepID=UPI000D62F342|nr:protein indeterminate-domain 2-like [Cynara cardunculus var. scolymus]
MVGFENSSMMAVSGTTVEATECDSAGNPTEPPLEMLPSKKKRNLPGNPDPDAEVIALSPKSLVAMNRFVCEICNKGFQRDQNLQLHRRGHNLPWKLKQRTGKEIRKRVYVCPEKTCVHHDPLRALGDLTGIKKHFSRKHGEKKWKCERCTKKYAVQSDWKAHMKICGSKEYRCDCGSLFSRRDTFITHRAFCDALAHESTITQSQTLALSSSDQQSPPTIMEEVVLPTTFSPPPPPLTPSTDVLSPAISFQTPELPENAMVAKVSGATTLTCLATTRATTTASTATTTVSGGSTSNSTSVFPSIYTSSVTIEPMSLSLSSSLYLSNTANPSLFPPPDHNLLHKLHHRYLPASQPALSATALLQKAAQMGAKSSNTSFLHALGLASPSSSSSNHRQDTNNGEWSNVHIKQERDDNSRLGLGIPFATAATTTTTTSLTDLMMGPPAPTTLDFLGLGMGSGSGGSPGGFSAYLASTGSGLYSGAGAASAVPLFRGMNSGINKIWDDSDDRKPDRL